MPLPQMPPSKRYTLEVCAASPEAVKASQGVADRIELCIGLEVGGLTPDAGLMALAAETQIETHVLIRPRCGDFAMTADELGVALRSIRATQEFGLAGVVIGAERDGALDQDALKAMIDAAGDLYVTLHRVIDVVKDPIAALEVAIELGCTRVLSSGGAPTAQAGRGALRQLQQASQGRIEIMAGGGITHRTLPMLMADSDLTSFHASCTTEQQLSPDYATRGFGVAARIFDRAELTRLAALFAE